MAKPIVQWPALSLAALVLSLGAGQQALATTQVPSSKVVSGQLVAPAAAFLYYGTATTATNTNDIQASPIVSGHATEIVELGNQLGAQDVIAGKITSQEYINRVFRYVRNNIDTAFTFGLAKGPYGTFADQAGTDFDQSSLMIELLSIANISATFEIGTISLTSQQFGLWTGLVTPTATNADGTLQSFTVTQAAACQFLANGGIPAAIDGSSQAACSYTGNLSSATIVHTWVNVGGVRYDPSYKVHTLYKGADLATAMGCGADAAQQCTAQLSTQALATSTTTTTNAVASLSSINTGAFATQINTYGRALEDYVQTNGYNRARQWLLGGKRFDLQGTNALAQAPISFVLNANLGAHVPDQYRISYAIAVDSINVRFWADEIASRRLRIFSDAGNETITSANSIYTRNMTLYVDWVPIANSSNAAANGYNDNLTITVNYPYAASSGTYLDLTYNRFLNNFAQYQTFKLGWPVLNSYPAPVTLVHQFGPASQVSVKLLGDAERSNYLDIPLRYPSLAPTLLPFIDQTSPRINSCEYASSVANTQIACWQLHQPTNLQIVLAEGSEVERLVGEIGKGQVTIHGAVGSVAGGGTSIEPTYSVTRNDGNTAAAGGLRVAANALPAWFEGGVNEQTQNLWEGVSGLSLLFRSMQGNIPVLDVNSANVAAASTQVQNFGTADISNMQNAATQGLNLVVPKNMSQSFSGIATGAGFGTITFDFNGAGAFSADYSTSSYLVRFIGKGGGAPTVDPLGMINSSTKIDDKVHHARDYGSIRLADGSAALRPFAKLDIGSGEFPASLDIVPSYAGRPMVDSARLVTTTTGKGVVRTKVETGDFGTIVGLNWKLNHGGKLTLGADGYRGMGTANALEATAIVPGIYALVNYGAAATTFQNRVLLTLASYQAGEQLVQNSLDIEISDQSLKLIRLPDGKYSLPGAKGWTVKRTGAASGPYMTTVGNGAGVGQYVFTGLAYDIIDSTGEDHNFQMLGGNLPTLDGSYPVLGFNEFSEYRSTKSDGRFVQYAYTAGSGGLNSDLTKYACLNSMTSYNGHVITLSLSTSSNHQCAALSAVDETGRSLQFGSPTLSSVFGNTGIGGIDPAINANGTSVQTMTGPDGTIDTFTSQVITDPGASNGLFARLGFDLTAWTHGSSNELNWTYNTVGQANKLTDANGHIWTTQTGASGGERWHEGRGISPLNEVSTKMTYNAADAQSIDPLGRTTIETLNEIDQPVREDLLGGGAIERTYDLRGNVLSECRIQNANGANHCNTATGDIKSSTAYVEGPGVWPCVNVKICNKPLYEIDAKNNQTDYVWCSPTNSACPYDNGLLYSKTAPADSAGNRPQTTYGYTAFAAADGSTFYLMTSKTDRIDATHTTTTTYTYNPARNWTLWSQVVDSGGLKLQTCFKFDAIGNVVSRTAPNANLAIGSCP